MASYHHAYHSVGVFFVCLFFLVVEPLGAWSEEAVGNSTGLVASLDSAVGHLL